nr:hypothetical protein [Tanacetum cinerariifolium]
MIPYPSPILVKDSDSLMEEIDLLCTLDYPMPPRIMDKDYDSERDILIPKDFPSNNSLSFAEQDSFHFDIPPFSRPPAKPPDEQSSIGCSIFIPLDSFKYGGIWSSSFDLKQALHGRKAAVLYEYETFKATEGDLLLDTYIRYLQVINDLKKSGYSKDNCELNFKFLNNLQPEWKQYATMTRQNKNLMDINIDALYNILKQNQGDVNDAMGSKKKTVVVTSDPLALIAEKTKAFNQRKFYSKPTNNNLRTSSSSQYANKKKDFVKTGDKKEDKKGDEKKRDMSRVKCYNCKKEGHFAKDCKKAKVKDYEYYKTKMLLAKKDKDEQVLLAEDQAWMESSSD